MALKSNSLIVIIPVYNEEKNIAYTLKKVIQELKKIKIKYQLLVVDDGSSDQTYKIISKFTSRNKKLNVIKHKRNKGYGAAINTGIKYANKFNYSYALFMDSDLTNDPKDIKKFVNEIKYDYDCVKASRYINGGNVIHVPAKRVIISKAGNFIASILFNVGVKDCTNGFLMLKPIFFKDNNLKEKGFAVIMEEMYYLKKKKAIFKEIPVALINRKTGQSSFNYSIETYFNYLKYPIKSLW